MNPTTKMIAEYTRKREDGRLTTVTAILRSIIPASDIFKIYSDSRRGKKLRRRYKVAGWFNFDSAKNTCNKVNAMLKRHPYLNAVASYHKGEIVVHVFKCVIDQLIQGIDSSTQKKAKPTASKDCSVPANVSTLKQIGLTYDQYSTWMKQATKEATKALMAAYPQYVEKYAQESKIRALRELAVCVKPFKLNEWEQDSDGAKLAFIGRGLAPMGLANKCIILSTKYDWKMLNQGGHTIMVPMIKRKAHH